MDDITRNLEIIDEFNYLLKKIRCSKLYGKEVNPYNMYEMVVSAYYVGRADEHGDVIFVGGEDEI